MARKEAPAQGSDANAHATSFAANRQDRRSSMGCASTTWQYGVALHWVIESESQGAHEANVVLPVEGVHS
jgi:hypothetical protein